MVRSDELKLPALSELGLDLLEVTPGQWALTIARPLGCFAAYWFFASHGWWPAAVLAVAGLMFFTYTSSSHDLVHRTLKLPRPCNEILLAVCEALALRSGHAFRIVHLNHHRRFPHHDDVEAVNACHGFWRALLAGPGHQTRHFLWAWPRANKTERCWMAAEASWAMAFLVFSAVYWQRLPQAAIFAALVTTSGWLYPLATVWWPHRAEGRDVLTQTRAFRGHLLPALFFQHTYHLEHHLYPMVASHNWRKLGARIEPYLVRAGVTIERVP